MGAPSSQSQGGAQGAGPLPVHQSRATGNGRTHGCTQVLQIQTTPATHAHAAAAGRRQRRQASSDLLLAVLRDTARYSSVAPATRSRCTLTSPAAAHMRCRRCCFRQAAVGSCCCAPASWGGAPASWPVGCSLAAASSSRCRQSLLHAHSTAPAAQQVEPGVPLLPVGLVTQPSARPLPLPPFPAPTSRPAPSPSSLSPTSRPAPSASSLSCSTAPAVAPCSPVTWLDGVGADHSRQHAADVPREAGLGHTQRGHQQAGHPGVLQAHSICWSAAGLGAHRSVVVPGRAAAAAWTGDGTALPGAWQAGVGCSSPAGAHLGGDLQAEHADLAAPQEACPHLEWRTTTARRVWAGCRGAYTPPATGSCRSRKEPSAITHPVTQAGAMLKWLQVLWGGGDPDDRPAAAVN